MVADARWSYPPDQLGDAARFRADLLAYRTACPPMGWGAARRTAQQPLGPARFGMLMVALNEQLPDAYDVLPPAGSPARGIPRHAGALGEPDGSPSLAEHRARLLGQ
jgi:hypothetical protein